MIRRSARNDSSAGSFRFDDGAKSLGDVIRKVQQQEQPPLESHVRPPEASELDRVRDRVLDLLQKPDTGSTYDEGYSDALNEVLDILQKTLDNRW